MSSLDKVIKKFKETRLKEGMSSKTVTGNTGGSVYRMESRTSVPKLDTFLLWCDRLGLKVKLEKKDVKTKK